MTGTNTFKLDAAKPFVAGFEVVPLFDAPILLRFSVCYNTPFDSYISLSDNPISRILKIRMVG